MALYGGVELPGHPCLANVAVLDRLPIPLIRNAYRVGIAIQPEYFHALTDRFTSEAGDCARDIASYIPTDRLSEFNARSAAIEESDGDAVFNPSSAEQIGKLLFEMLGIGQSKRLKRTSTGRVSTGKKQLELVKAEHPVVGRVLRHRELSKLVSNYTAKLPAMARFHPRSLCCPVCELPHSTDQWRVHGEMGTTRADTGRINHKNPNLGNVATRTYDGQLVQAGFVAPPGYRIVSRDLSQIELRDLAHLSNCKSMIDTYLNDGDIHDDTAHRALAVPWDQKPDKIRHRMAAKRCIAKGQRVLTDRGLVAIENVTCQDSVWDGTDFVRHEGVVYQGKRNVITYDGLTCTPDHTIYTCDGRKMSASEAQRRDIVLAVTGIEERPVWYPHDYLRPYLQQCQWLLMCYSNLLAVSTNTYCTYRQLEKSGRMFLPEESQVSQSGRNTVSRTLSRDSAALRESIKRELEELRRAWHSEFIQVCRRVRRICQANAAAPDLQGTSYWEEGQRRTLHAWKFAFGDACSEHAKQTHEPMGNLQRIADYRNRFAWPLVTRLSRLPAWGETYLPSGEGWNCLDGDTQTESERTLQETEVYDILNAGPYHRFTVEGKLVANCNFGIQNGTTEKGLYMQLVMDFGTNGIPIPDWLTEDWCKWFIGQWLDSRPEVRDYFELQWYRARRYRLVWDAFGRVKPIPETQSYHSWIRESGLRQAQNMPVTATAAGQLKLAMGQSDELLTDLRRDNIHAWPLLTVHDSEMVEVEEDYTDVVSEILQYSMDSCMTDRETGEHRFRVPIRSDGDVSQRWVKSDEFQEKWESEYGAEFGIN